MLTGPLQWLLVAALAVAIVRRDVRALALGALAGAWVLVVAQMTASGYSGNERYLIVPVALLMVVAAATLAAGAGSLAARAGIGRHPWAAGVLAVLAAAYCAAPWVDQDRFVLSDVRYQASLISQLHDSVASAGGPAAVRGCGPVVTGAYMVPAVAWNLGLHIDDVRLVPEERSTVLRVHNHPGSYPMPGLDPLAHKPVRTLVRTPAWRIVTTCGAPHR
jgi:hypothetical protein